MSMPQLAPNIQDKTQIRQKSLLQRNRDSYLWIKVIIGLIAAVLFILPVIWMIFVSLKPDGYVTKNPVEWFLPPYTLDNYTRLLEESLILKWTWNSFIVAFITTLLSLLVTSLAAFAISRLKFRYKNFILVFFLLGLMIPGEATIIPLYEVAKSLGLIDTYAGLILPMIASSMGIIVLKSFFDNVPKELIESAVIDGCSTFKLFYKIILPLSKPAISAIGIFTFIGSWNNFLWPYLATLSEDLYTLPVGIPVFNSNYSTAYVLPMTANAIASIPVIIAFLIFEKQIVKGISFTGIKG
ncbi:MULTISPECIES: carbohydrate ABC transporter permease [Geobacillus]|jgi:multiple sugar transport system permease protein|uniref:Putative integral membranebinding-protein-dependent transport protein n=1 Tax=Geobacillus thermodenitrificans (strain NG80-2) TaxID=420246 RepID=A4IKD4_GEOTN|nr:MULTISPECIES: carbohydrate ABC transporter permease [Geobacillus]ABO65788.1 Putative integral membranebinding-protein-dependent transport protein [Geobacillus thermodenitrificans NG80-2]ARA97763.1 sugar ABC transporter permease [Geobacillus thermodenitrificans]MED3718425.1 carbohydrate ABC transporter permease [Geobacillus thermodenitrificans]